MWTLIVNPVVVVVIVSAVMIVCRATGADPAGRDMALAAVICLVAAEIAVVPVALGPKGAPDLFRAAFAGTVLHLLVAVLLGAAVIFVLKPGLPFVVWLLVMYWVTLIVFCAVCVRLFRSPAGMTKSNSNGRV